MTPTWKRVLSALASAGLVVALGITSSAKPSGRTQPEAADQGLVEPNVEPEPATNFPLPSISRSGTHCPMAEIPGYADSMYDLESGRAELYFYDTAYQQSRTIILDLDDPACWEGGGTRPALLHMLFTSIQNTMEPVAESDQAAIACQRLRDAIREGSIRFEQRPFDLRPAQPYVDEVCAF